jgi:hypothetical protein
MVHRAMDNVYGFIQGAHDSRRLYASHLNALITHVSRPLPTPVVTPDRTGIDASSTASTTYLHAMKSCAMWA